MPNVVVVPNVVVRLVAVAKVVVRLVARFVETSKSVTNVVVVLYVVVRLVAVANVVVNPVTTLVDLLVAPPVVLVERVVERVVSLCVLL